MEQTNSNNLFTINLNKDDGKMRKEREHMRSGWPVEEKDRLDNTSLRNICFINDNMAEVLVKVDADSVGPSRCKRDGKDVIISYCAEQEVLAIKGCAYSVEIPSEEEADKKALALYEKKGMVDVIEILSNLQLKRDAVDELEAAVKKKRRLDV